MDWIIPAIFSVLFSVSSGFQFYFLRRIDKNYDKLEKNYEKKTEEVKKNLTKLTNWANFVSGELGLKPPED